MEPNPYEAPQQAACQPLDSASDDDPLFVIATTGVIGVAGMFLALIVLASLVGMVTNMRLAAMRANCTNGVKEQVVRGPGFADCAATDESPAPRSN